MSPKRKYTDEDMLEVLRKNPDLSCREWNSKNIKPCTMTIQTRFGSWNKARKAAGLEERSQGSPTKNEEKILELIEENGPMTRPELLEKMGKKGIKLYKYDVPLVEMTVTRGPGGHKYGILDITDINHGTQIVYKNPIKLADFIEEHIKFELNPMLLGSKKCTLTAFLNDWRNDGLPEETFECLRKKYR